mgnify:CR=1 FL=1
MANAIGLPDYHSNMKRFYVYRSGEQGVYVIANNPEDAVKEALEIRDFGEDEIFAVSEWTPLTNSYRAKARRKGEMKMKKQILHAIQTGLNEKCGQVRYDRVARDWQISGIFLADITAVMEQLQKIGLSRKQSAWGFFVEKN